MTTTNRYLLTPEGLVRVEREVRREPGEPTFSVGPACLTAAFAGAAASWLIMLSDEVPHATAAWWLVASLPIVACLGARAVGQATFRASQWNLDRARAAFLSVVALGALSAWGWTGVRSQQSELAQRTLAQRIDESTTAMHAASAQGDLSAGASHLRTMLTATRAALPMLKGQAYIDARAGERTLAQLVSERTAMDAAAHPRANFFDPSSITSREDLASRRKDLEDSLGSLLASSAHAQAASRTAYDQLQASGASRAYSGALLAHLQDALGSTARASGALAQLLGSQRECLALLDEQWGCWTSDPSTGLVAFDSDPSQHAWESASETTRLCAVQYARELSEFARASAPGSAFVSAESPREEQSLLDPL